MNNICPKIDLFPSEAFKKLIGPFKKILSPHLSSAGKFAPPPFPSNHSLWNAIMTLNSRPTQGFVETHRNNSD